MIRVGAISISLLLSCAVATAQEIVPHDTGTKISVDVQHHAISTAGELIPVEQMGLTYLLRFTFDSNVPGYERFSTQFGTDQATAIAFVNLVQQEWDMFLSLQDQQEKDFCDARLYSDSLAWARAEEAKEVQDRRWLIEAFGRLRENTEPLLWAKVLQAINEGKKGAMRTSFDHFAAAAEYKDTYAQMIDKHCADVQSSGWRN